jgi:rhodanese-related sulfurtransferase
MQVFTFTQHEKETLSHFELSQWMEENRDFLLVDIRNDEEIKGGDLGGVRISMVTAWPKEKKIVLYCQRGIRSHAMAKQLRQRGISAYSLEGGFVAHGRTK